MTLNRDGWHTVGRWLAVYSCVLAAAAAQAQSNCDAKRHGVVGKLAKDVQKCVAKAEKAASDPAACIGAAQTKAQDKWNQASSKGDCDADASFSILTSAVTSFSASVEDAVHGGSLCCASVDLNSTFTMASNPNPTCYQFDPVKDAADGGFCAVQGGTPVVTNRCSSDGSCVASPTAGGCCDNIQAIVQLPSMQCVVTDQTSCGQDLLGTFHPNALCTPAGCQ
jgi:hypothetical protein